MAALVLALAVFGGTCGGEGSADQAPLTTASAPVYTRYASANAAIVRYCAGCHAKGGQDPQHARAYQVLTLDGYQDWRSQTTVIAAVLDDQHPDGNVMPPPDAPAHPTDAERALLLDWTRRGAPDTPDGQ